MILFFFQRHILYPMFSINRIQTHSGFLIFQSHIHVFYLPNSAYLKNNSAGASFVHSLEIVLKISNSINSWRFCFRFLQAYCRRSFRSKVQCVNNVESKRKRRNFTTNRLVTLFSASKRLKLRLRPSRPGGGLILTNKIAAKFSGNITWRDGSESRLFFIFPDRNQNHSSFSRN